jgi:hypothetical protein
VTGLNMDYKQVVWLSSYPKSGNTWLRCFIDAYLMEQVDINNIIASVTDDGSQRALPGVDDSDPATYPLDVQILTRPMALLRLVQQFELNRIETGTNVPLFVKTHNAHMVTNGVELLPCALTKSVIHIVRDPRDVIISFAKHMGKDTDEAIKLFFDKYRVLHDKRRPKLADFISSWSAHVASYANANTHNVRVFKYEDMKSDPINTFSEILIHAGIKPNKKRVEKAIELVSLANLKKQEDAKGFRESSPFAKNKFFGEGKSGGWQDKLTPNQIHRVEKNCQSMMKRFGYDKSNMLKRRVA